MIHGPIYNKVFFPFYGCINIDFCKKLLGHLERGISVFLVHF